MSLFSPVVAGGVTISATQASGATDLGTNGDAVWVCNLGANDAFVEFGGSTVAVVKDTGFCVPTDREVYLRRNPNAGQYIAAVCETGETATLKVCPGYKR